MMQLTRRDAILAMIGGASITSLSLYEIREFDSGFRVLSASEIDVLIAVTEVIYPSEIEVTQGYVEGFVGGLSEDRADAVRRTAFELDRLSRNENSTHFPDASVAKREDILKNLGVDRVQSRTEGTLAERVRYHLVNSLLYLLFTTPKGSTLFGIENPIGYPGGLESYQRKP